MLSYDRQNAPITANQKVYRVLELYDDIELSYHIDELGQRKSKHADMTVCNMHQYTSTDASAGYQVRCCTAYLPRIM